MSIAEEFISSRYEKLTTFSEKDEGDVELLRLSGTTQLYIRKELDERAYKIAEKLKNINNVHINCPTLIYENNGKPYSISPYISGKTIEEMLEEKGVFSLKEACGYMEQLLDGMTAFHAFGMVHRDITASNVMITHEEVVKILDFGISRENIPNKSRDTTILGTEGYAAPEQFGFRQTDARTDIYAAGVLFNRMLTGKFPNDQLADDIFAAKIINKATAIDSSDRFISAADMKEYIMRRKTDFPVSLWDRWKKKNLPGFRTGILWKKILATIIYTLTTFCTLIYVMDALVITKEDVIKEILSATIAFMIPPLCIGNVCNWDQKVPILSNMPFILRLIIRIIVAILIFILGALMYVGVPK